MQSMTVQFVRIVFIYFSLINGLVFARTVVVGLNPTPLPMPDKLAQITPGKLCSPTWSGANDSSPQAYLRAELVLFEHQHAIKGDGG